MLMEKSGKNFSVERTREDGIEMKTSMLVISYVLSQKVAF